MFTATRVGDFNFKNINWSSWTTPHSEDSVESTFIEAVRDCYLHQHVEQATRRRGNDDPSLLDLILTDEAMQVSDILHHSPLGKNGHSVITFEFHCCLDCTKPKDKFPDANSDYVAMRNNLTNSEWNREYMEEMSEETAVENLWFSKSKLTDLRNLFVPKQSTSGEPSCKDKGSCPIDKHTRDAIRSNTKTYRAWMSAKNRGDIETVRLKYTKARNKAKRMLRQSKKLFVQQIALRAKNIPKAWSHTRRKLKIKCGVAPLLSKINDKNSQKFDDEEKANILQNQFSSVFTHEPEGKIPRIASRTDSSISGLYVTERWC